MQTPLWPTTQQRHRAFHHPNRSLVPLPVKGRYGTLYTYTDQCPSQKQGHTLTQAWPNCQNMDINNANNSMIESTDLINFTHFLTIILLEKDTFLYWMQSRITHHTYLNCHLSVLQSGDSCFHWAFTSSQTRLCRLPPTWVCLSIPQDIQPQKWVCPSQGILSGGTMPACPYTGLAQG